MKSLFRHRLCFPIPAFLGMILLLNSPGSAHATVTYNNWSSSGPFPAPAKAVVTALAIAPTTPVATIFNGTDSAGIAAMSEGGSSWSPANSGLKNLQVQGLAVHPVDPKIVYAGTREGVFKSSDGGVSWSGFSIGLTSNNVRALAIDPQTPATLYAATDAGVSKSFNNGTGWVAANTGLASLDVRALLIDPTASNVLYAATAGGVFQSTDGAAHWGLIDTGLGSTDVLCLAYAATTPPTIFAGTNGGGVFASGDGATWTADNTGLTNLVVSAILIDNPQAPSLAYAGTANGLFKQPYSAGTWSNWTAASTGITVPAAIHAIANDPTSRATVYAGSDLGVFRSTNQAASWSVLSAGLRQGSALAIKPNDATILVAGLGAGGVYRSSNSASSWIASASSEPATPTALLFDPSGTPLYAGSGSGVFKSGDDGVTWSDISNNLANTNVRALAFGSGSALHAATAEGVFVWNSGTLTWAAYGGGQPQNNDVTSLAYRASSLFAGTNGGGVYRSDGGGSWTQANTGLTNTVISSLAFDASNIYAGTPAGVFRSADNGSTWSAVNSGITNLGIKSLAITTGTPALLTAGTNGGGVFFSVTAGNVWIPLNTGLSDTTIGALSVNASNVYAASAGASIFGLNLSPVSVVLPAAPLRASPVDFGPVNLADTKTTIFTLQNSGTLPLNVSSLALSGTDSALFSIVPGGGRQCTLPAATIAAGDYCTVSVDFTPASTGIKSATLTTSSDAPNQPVTTFLTGKGGYPPQASITFPAGGATVRNPAVISGTALDVNQVTGTNGTGSTLVKVEVSTDNGTTWNSAVKNPTLNSWTQWSYSWTATPLPLNGPYTIAARATDSNGFVQTTLSSLSLTVDNTPPVTTITSQPKPLDNSASGSFSFTVSKPGSTSQCQLDGQAPVSCATSFSYLNLSDGSHSFSVLSTDTVGNVESPAKSYSWVIDTIPPSVTIGSEPAQYTQASSASFAFSANEANSTFQCTLDGVALACTSPKSYANLADGNHIFSVQATDPAGNTTLAAPSTQSYSWIVDKLNKPSSSINAPLAPLAGLNYTLSGTATDSVSGVQMVNLSINNGTLYAAVNNSTLPAQPWSSWSYLWSLPVNGTYTVQAQATDNAGNLQTSPASTSFIVANPIPAAQIVSPATASLIGGNSPRVISGTAQAAAGGLPLQKVQVAVFPSSNPPATLSWSDASGASNWSYNWQFPADGSYTIQARALDVAPNLSGAVVGNASSIVSTTVTIDTTPPVSTITALPNPYLKGRFVTLSGTAADPTPGTGVKQVLITITDSSGQATSGAALYNSGAQTWSYTSGTLADGSYTVQSSATDYAGNQQLNPGTVTITIDNIPPVTTITGEPATLSNQQVASFSFTANEPATFSCTLDGVTAPCVCMNQTATSCTQNFSGLGNGAHSFSVLAKDSAGNLETGAKSASWSIDLVPPAVNGVTPANGATRISVAGSTLTASFSKDLDPASVSSATFSLNNGATGTVTYNPATHTATLTPNAPLAYATTYTATVSGVADPAGNRLAGNYSWSFSTDPDGDVNLDGKVDIADAMLCLQMAVGLVTPTAEQLRHGDVAPFKNGKPDPDGKIDASDALIILSKVIGLINW